MKTISQKKASDCLNFVVNDGGEKIETQTEDGVAIPYSRIKTWFDNLIQPEDFTSCQDVDDRITFKIEENFAIRLRKEQGQTRCYTGKVGHVENQTFHIQDVHLGKIWLEFELADFFTWDFNVTDVEHKMKVSDNGQQSILFLVTHVWVDLSEYAMAFFYQNTMVCRKTIELPFFISKWLIDNAINWALKRLEISEPEL